MDRSFTSFIEFLLSHLPICQVAQIIISLFQSYADDTETEIDDVAVECIRAALRYILPDCTGI